MNKSFQYFAGLLVFLLFFSLNTWGAGGGKVIPLFDQYIKEWKGFYPSEALAAGDSSSGSKFEDFSLKRINSWLSFNKITLTSIKAIGPLDKLPFNDRIDYRLLKRRVLMEIDKWEFDGPHENSPVLYANRISQALPHILARTPVGQKGTYRIILARLEGINRLCQNGIRELKNGSGEKTRDAIAGLEKSAFFYEKNLTDIMKVQRWLEAQKETLFQEKTAQTAANIRRLARYINEKIVPKMTLPDVMGKVKYNHKLKLYTNTNPPLTSQELDKIALEEIGRVRRKMTELAGLWWRATNPGKKAPRSPGELVAAALEVMEANREDNQQNFLKLFKRLINRSESFMREKGFVTLPAKRTLFTDLSPAHFSGAAVGGVYPAGPFNPGADTLFYLPTVPDETPAAAKEGFYRSFNNHFNTMIITHEIYPGHYLQLKMASTNPHRIRSLFGDDLYVEGWATLCEQITLDAGWDKGNILTKLAHLRKRLENATRAYVSVQVHCNIWNQDQLKNFAVKKGLLPPQFATNLWSRVIHSPHQLTSYFLGFRAFARLLELEKKRLGDNFKIREFNDRILNAGAIPLDELPSLLTRISHK